MISSRETTKLETLKPLRIAYVFHWIQSTESGVSKKIVNQLRAWKAFGHDVHAFQYSRDEHRSHQHAFGDDVAWKEFPYRAGYARRLLDWKFLARAVQAWNPDVIYFRYDVYAPSLYSLFRNRPVVFEVNTDDSVEFQMGSWVRGAYNRLTRTRMIHSASGLVFASNTVSKRPSFNMQLPSEVIGNSIDISSVPDWGENRGNGREAVMIGSKECTWQGIDKLASLAEAMRDWTFHVVGCDGDDTENLRFHGFLPRSEYEKLFYRCSVGIGSLALHRYGVDENSTLKAAEYLAYGLPVLLAYQETDFPGDYDYICRIPNVESNVTTNLDSIRDFMNRWVGRRVARSAVAHLDVSVKEARRLEFLQRVAGA